jgi:hypothetical protein
MGKNLQRVQDMVDGNYQTKIQTGYEAPIDLKRKIGDKWTDSDDVQWEQKNGYKSKLTKTRNVGIFTHQCSDCKKGCITSYDKDTHKRMGRCYYCQIDFEVILKSKRIGQNGTKWQFWVKLQQLSNWDAIDRETEQYIFTKHDEKSKRIYDEGVANALANANVQDAFKINKRLVE